MFIAHIPFAYIVAKKIKERKLWIALMIGSVLPDFDLLYFYSFGQRAHSHHTYYTHTPFFWVVICMISFLISKLAKLHIEKISLALFAGVLTHLVLDTVAGGIEWFSPFSNQVIVMTYVPSLYHPWILNFFFHWTFGIELFICAVAAFIFFKSNIMRTTDS